MLIEGETPATMAKSTGLGLIELPTVFERLQPDVVITSATASRRWRPRSRPPT